MSTLDGWQTPQSPTQVDTSFRIDGTVMPRLNVPTRCDRTPGSASIPTKRSLNRCVYLVSQLTVPVALINERLSEGHDPNDFHFMRYVRCPDVGVECLGYGEVMLKVQVVPRQK